MGSSGINALHVVVGDFNAQVAEPDDEEMNEERAVGPYRHERKHHLEDMVFEKLAGFPGSWVHADSFLTAMGTRRRFTWWYHKDNVGYESDWMLVARQHLRRLKK